MCRGAQALRRSDRVGFAGERGLEAGEMDAILAKEIRRDHRAVECWKTDLIEQAQLKTSHVAVCEKRLGIIADQFEIEVLEQVVGAVTTAHSSNDADVGIGKRCMQVFKPLCGCARKKERTTCLGLRADPG